MSAQVAADLRAAAEVLERDGWTQGQLHKVTPNSCEHCVLGAITSAVTGDFWPKISQLNVTEWTRFNEARVALRDHRGGGSNADWNDAKGRTADEVISALRAAADVAEVEG